MQNTASYSRILVKLKAFTSKYYTRQLLIGLLMFISLGMFFILLAMTLEYLLWLGTAERTIMFTVMLLAEGFLLYKYILTPAALLLRLKKGITEKRASRIIGRHFPEVSDKLYNLLELAENDNQSELLVASIEQRSKSLGTIPFVNAIRLKDSLAYSKYLLIPISILIGIWLFGNVRDWLGSYKRVVNYNTAYTPPAPFQFHLLTPELEILENETAVIRVGTQGNIKPEDVLIVYNGREIYMQSTGDVFQHILEPPVSSGQFYFKANEVRSRDYELNVLKIPSIMSFQMNLNYPEYTGKTDESLLSSGNAVIPEGTIVNWQIRGDEMTEVLQIEGDSVRSFDKNDGLFELERSIYRDLDYSISTGNENVSNYESLRFKLAVTPDAQPQIEVQETKDSLNGNWAYYSGQLSDDYLVTELRLVVMPEGDEEQQETLILDKPEKAFQQFYYTFPTGFQPEEGVVYEYYFEVEDNDQLRGGKVSRSQIFRTRIYDREERRSLQLDSQKKLIDEFDNTLKRYKEDKEDVNKLVREQKESQSNSFADQQRIKQILQQQQQQEQLMERFTKDLKENLEQKGNRDEMDRLLKERLERQELEARKNKRLLEELKKVADKIEKSELSKRLEELAKNQRKGERNLEQLLELTKRYYVTEKASKLARDLEKLAEEQKRLAESQKKEGELQKQIENNKSFEELSEALEGLIKDNQDLKKPMSLKVDSKKKEEIKSEQQAAEEKLRERDGEDENSDEEGDNDRNSIKKNQRSAAEKMKQMSEELMQSMAGGASEGMEEDAEMLRQILDNLVTFSFKQERLYDFLNQRDFDLSQFSGTVRKQKELRSLFEHVDDSLFALSLRRPELSEFVNEQIEEAYYNMDKSVESITEGRIYQSVSYQQYVLNSANSLADFLADILENMQQSMGQGSGAGNSGQDFQLPDIITGQQQLAQKMQNQGSKGNQKGKGEKSEGNEGQQGSGQDGDSEPGENKGDTGTGNGDQKGDEKGGEESLEEVYEIYKEQQRIRQMLEKQLENMIRERDKNLAKKLLQQMEDFENELLEQGITERTMNRMRNIEHQMLRMENAEMEQGQKEERESRSNEEIFQNPVMTKPRAFDVEEESIEILYRQALPLHQIYKNRVKRYFNNAN